MSDAQNYGFAQFVPGFDFLQNLAKGAAAGGMPQMPGLSNWIAPTLSVEELDKRISELRAVLFWLEQNGKALQATIQALEVQKMTLATLKGMDVTMADMAEALKVKVPAAEPASGQAADAEAKDQPAQGAAGAHQVVDPLQWWSSLTQQFQQIAANAMQQAAQNNPMEAAREAATGMAEQAIEAASRMSAAATGATAAKAPARKAAGKAAASTRTSAKQAGTASRKTAPPRKSPGGRGTTR